MSEINPATPAQAATPGNGEQGNQPASVVTPPTTTPAAGGAPEGTVVISTKEYGELQRAKARALAFDRRKGFGPTRGQAPNPDSGDPNAAASAALDEANARALRAEVRNQVRDILEKPEYASLPESTKNLILKNPHMLSEADNLEDALEDIEGFIAEEAAAAAAIAATKTQNGGQGQGSRSQDPAGHETPRAVATTTPAPTPAAGLEETSNLSGPNRSQAVLRNAIRKAKGVKSE